MERLKALYQDPIPAGLRFEKLKGHARPDIYTFHIDGNYKVSIEIHGNHAVLRRVAPHNSIERLP